MKKSDHSLKHICIAKIERSYIPPFDFSYTGIFKDSYANFPNDTLSNISLEEGEELICSTFINRETWTLLTTRRVFSMEGSVEFVHAMNGVKHKNFGDFKRSASQLYTKGKLLFSDGTEMPIIIETGRASMVLINGIMTLDQLVREKE